MTIPLLLAALLFFAGPAAAPSAQQLVREGQDLYRQGSLGEALLKFEEAVKAGAQDGEMFYRMGYCYKAARQDAEKSREFMVKAVPLLEKVVEPSARPGPAPFYYLSAIYITDLVEPAKGAEIARRGASQADEGLFASFKDGESLFQIGRLYTLAGQQDKAVGWYEKAVDGLQTGPMPNKVYLTSCLDQLVGYFMGKADYARAAEWLKRLLELDPGRDPQRLSGGLAMVRAGLYKEAIAILQGFTNEDFATEANYVNRIITRYLDVGSPAASAETSKLDDNALQQAIVASAQRLSEIRRKEDEEAQGRPPVGSVIPATPLPEEGKPQPRRVKIKDPAHPTMQEYEAFYGIVTPPPTLPPPPSAERLASEKEFFGLLMEYLRRGHVVQEMAMSQGIASMIFR